MVRPRCLKATLYFNDDFAKRSIANSKTDKGVLMVRWRQYKCVEKIYLFFFKIEREAIFSHIFIKNMQK